MTFDPCRLESPLQCALTIITTTAVFLLLLVLPPPPPLWLCCLQEEDEVDLGTMVRTGGADTGTIRAAPGSLPGTMVEATLVEYPGTVQSRMGTMVITSGPEDGEDEDGGGTMKSERAPAR